MTRKKKTKRSPAMMYAVRYGDLDSLQSFHYLFIDFKNRIALNMDGKEFSLGPTLIRDRFIILQNRARWKWINKHEALKVRIGGFQYVKDTYGLRS